MATATDALALDSTLQRVADALEAQNLIQDASDLHIIDIRKLTGSDETTTQALINAIIALMNTDGAGFHNCIYRGKNLGTSLTEAQRGKIADGTFDDLFIGDYWIINNITWRIAHFDYWWNTGDTTVCNQHHAVIVPDSNLGANKQMETSNITTNGYHGSQMGLRNADTGVPTGNLLEAYNAVVSAFGATNILKKREMFTNGSADGAPNAYAYCWSLVDLMNENMVYGAPIFSLTGRASASLGKVPNIYTWDKTQLQLFALRPELITNRAAWWLRDVVSATTFANVNSYGYASHASASGTGLGVRPAFGIV